VLGQSGALTAAYGRGLGSRGTPIGGNRGGGGAGLGFGPEPITGVIPGGGFYPPISGTPPLIPDGSVKGIPGFGQLSASQVISILKLFVKRGMISAALFELIRKTGEIPPEILQRIFIWVAEGPAGWQNAVPAPVAGGKKRPRRGRGRPPIGQSGARPRRPPRPAAQPGRGVPVTISTPMLMPDQARVLTATPPLPELPRLRPIPAQPGQLREPIPSAPQTAPQRPIPGVTMSGLPAQQSTPLPSTGPATGPTTSVSPTPWYMGLVAGVGLIARGLLRNARTNQANILGFAPDSAVVGSIQPLSRANPSAVPQEQADKCEQVKRRRRKKGKCREGFFRESPGSTKYVTWRERRCQ